MGSDKQTEVKRPYLFQVKTTIQSTETLSVFLLRSRKGELRGYLDDYVKTFLPDYSHYDSASNEHVFKKGTIRCRIGRVSLVTENIAFSLVNTGMVIDISSFNQPVTYDQILKVTKSINKPRGVIMSGRLHLKEFATCTRCSTSVITGKPNASDPTWNSAHLYDALKSEERSFRNIHSVSLDEKLNISWGVPVTGEIIDGEGRCEFCHSYCEKKRIKVTMVVVI